MAYVERTKLACILLFLALWNFFSNLPSDERVLWQSKNAFTSAGNALGKLNTMTFGFIILSFVALPCIVISVVNPQVGQMIDFGFSENEMMDGCLPLTLRDGDYKRRNRQQIDIINHASCCCSCLLYP